MRFISPALALTLALAPLAAAHADGPFDGAEVAGTPCAGVVTTLGVDHYGTLTGGVYVIADLLANDNGIVHVSSTPGPIQGAVLTCSIRNSSGGTEATVTRTSTEGVVVVEPQVVAFNSNYTTGFKACTHLSWTDSDGSWYIDTCLPAGA